MQPLPTLPAVEQHSRPVGQLHPLLVQTTSSSTPMQPPGDNVGAPSWHGSIPPLFQQVGYGKGEPEVIIQLERGTIGAHYCILDGAHYCILDARSPGFLKRHIHTATTCSDGKVQISMDGGDMPAPSVWALIQFTYTDALPVPGGLDGAVTRRCSSTSLSPPSATLAMADRHGFKKLSEACAKFMAFP
ncbi:hypothetical protein ZWY2020_016131 [Hordeum vulgare]|nr:hypothetical protein ZWY2020_016131 [Hordeum vulgare]